ncbi:MAG: hypothetical protein U0T81_16040 [Saprospiraceae bacterium]
MMKSSWMKVMPDQLWWPQTARAKKSVISACQVLYSQFESTNGVSCARDVDKELRKLVAEGAKSLIFGSRNNGYVLQEVVEMSGLFFKTALSFRFGIKTVPIPTVILILGFLSMDRWLFWSTAIVHPLQKSLWIRGV